MFFLQQTVYGRSQSNVFGNDQLAASLVVGVQDLGPKERSQQTVCSIGFGTPLVDTSIRPVSLLREWSPGLGVSNHSRNSIDQYLEFLDRVVDTGQIIKAPWSSFDMPVSSEADAVYLCLSHINYHLGDLGGNGGWKPLGGEMGLKKHKFIELEDIYSASNKLALLYTSLKYFGVSKRIYHTLMELALAADSVNTDNFTQEELREKFLDVAKIKRTSDDSHKDTYKFFQGLLLKLRRRNAIDHVNIGKAKKPIDNFLVAQRSLGVENPVHP